MSTMSIGRDPLRLAVVGLIGIAALIAVAVNFNRLPLVGNEGTPYVAQFTDASGLAVGEEVVVAGLKVGVVKDIALAGTHVDVTFTAAGVDLGDRTTASIEIKSLLGQHALMIDPSGSHPLAAHGVIPLARTTTPVNIVPAFERLTRVTGKIDEGQVAAAFTALADTLRTTAPNLRPTLQGLSRLSLTVSSRDDEIGTLLDRTKSVSGVVAARDKDLAGLLGSTNAVLKVLDARRATIRRIITGTRLLATQLIGLVADNRTRLKPALTQLNVVLDVLRKDEKQLDEILTYGTTYEREFTNVGGTGRWFDASITVPQGYQLCSPASQGPLSSILDPLLSQISSSTGGGGSPCLPLGPAIASRLNSGGTP